MSIEAAVIKYYFCFPPQPVRTYFSLGVVHFHGNWIESFYLLRWTSLQSFVKHLWDSNKVLKLNHKKTDNLGLGGDLKNFLGLTHEKVSEMRWLPVCRLQHRKVRATVQVTFCQWICVEPLLKWDQRSEWRNSQPRSSTSLGSTLRPAN